MTDPTDARSKAEASHRLAELAKTPRARELFRQLAEEYDSRAKAEASEQGEAAPSIVPLAPTEPLSDSEQWLADLKAVRQES